MKLGKILGPLAVVVAAMMAFAASASADYVTTTTGGATPALNSETIHAVNEPTHVNLENTIAKIECNSTAEGKVSSHFGGTSGSAAQGAFTSMFFSSCTNRLACDSEFHWPLLD